MRNYCQILLQALTILLTVNFSVYCHAYYFFDVNENEAQVEKLVIKYTRSLPKPKTKLTQLVGRAVDFISELVIPSDTEFDTNQFENFKVENVCDQTKRNKLFMCRVMMRLNYFGFEFDTNRSEDIPCNKYKISLHHRPVHKLDTDELEMFQCPPLKYIKLATDEPIFLQVRYFISSTHEPQSFFFYIQEEPHLPIYPHRFASNMYFNSFHRLRDHVNINETLDQSDAGKLSLYKLASSTEKRISEFVKITRFSKVYEKFRQFYKKQILCAMPFSHKVAVCRYIAKEMNLKVDYRGYDESRCRKRKVFSNPATPEDINGQFMSLLQTLKCPALYEPNENGNKLIFKTMYLTSSHLHETAVFVLQRLNLQQHEVKPEAYTYNIGLQMLPKERRRIREYKYLKRDNSKTFARIYDSPRKPGQRPQLIKLLQSSPLVLFNRAFIENSIISFAQMKQARKPYQRFMQSKSSISINMWLEAEITFLCRIILEEEPYNLDFEVTLTNFAYRSHIDAELIMRDAESLPSKKIIARQCAPHFKSSSTFFIVATTNADAAIVFVRYENEPYIIPHSYVHNIQKAEIRKAIGDKTVTPSLI